MSTIRVSRNVEVHIGPRCAHTKVMAFGRAIGPFARLVIDVDSRHTRPSLTLSTVRGVVVDGLAAAVRDVQREGLFDVEISEVDQ